MNQKKNSEEKICNDFVAGGNYDICYGFCFAAQGPDGSGWWTSPSVQNVSTGNATIVFTAYHNTDSTNTSTYSGSAVLAPNSSVIYHLV